MEAEIVLIIWDVFFEPYVTVKSSESYATVRTFQINKIVKS